MAIIIAVRQRVWTSSISLSNTDAVAIAVTKIYIQGNLSER